LCQAESGITVRELCREHGIIAATFYIRKKKYSGPSLSELRELRQHARRTASSKRLVADLSLESAHPQEIMANALACWPLKVPSGNRPDARLINGFDQILDDLPWIETMSVIPSPSSDSAKSHTSHTVSCG
jgi:putative transposase